MDKRLFVRVIAGIVALIGVALIVLPNLSRVSMVATFGVLTANTLSLVMLILGIVIVVAMAGYLARSIIVEKARKLVLPSAEETDPVKIRNSLKRVAKRYPAVKSLIEKSIQQLDSVQLSLDKIDEIFRLNPGLFIAGDDQFGYGTYSLRLQGVRQEISRGLVLNVIYAAYSPDEDRKISVWELERAIQGENAINQKRVELARELEATTIKTLGSNNIETTELQGLLNQLTNTKTKGEIQ
jgi:hypothetical protein